MLRALREVVETPGRNPIRVGVNTGKVFAGDFGPPYRRAYRVFGDAVNTAARVMSRAEPGQILATDVVLERSRTVVSRRRRSSRSPPRARRCRSRRRSSVPLPATEESHGGGLRRPSPNCEHCSRVVDAASAGSGSTVELFGRPGLGKSHLVEELLDASPGLEVFRGRCDEYQSATPVLSAFGARSGTFWTSSPDATHEEVESAPTGRRRCTSPAPPALAARSGAIPFGLELPPTPESSRLDERFLRGGSPSSRPSSSRRCSATGWPCSSSRTSSSSTRRRLDLLRESRASRSLRKAGAAGSCSSRGGSRRRMFAPRGRGRGRGSSLALGLSLLPLPLSRARRCRHLHGGRSAAASRRRRGRAPVRRVTSSSSSSCWTWRAPDAIGRRAPGHCRDAIAADIDRLAPRDRDLLRYASVLGTVVRPGAARLGGPRTSSSVDEAAWSRLGDLIEPDPGGGRRFRNATHPGHRLRGASVPAPAAAARLAREAIEARAGDRVDEESATLALHFHEAQQWEKSWLHGRRAGERAMELYANAEAAVVLERAIEAGRGCEGSGASRSRRPTRRSVTFATGSVSSTDLRQLQGRATAARPGVARRHEELALKEALIPMRFGNYPPALRRLSRGLRALEHGRGRRSRPQAGPASSRVRRGAISARTARGCDRLVTAGGARGARGNAPDALAYAYTVHDLALLGSGRAIAATHGPAALAIFEELGDLVLAGSDAEQHGTDRLRAGHWSESLALYDRAGAIWESMGDRWSATFAKYNRGEILSDQGRFERRRRACARRSASGAPPEPRRRSLRPFASSAGWQSRRGEAETARRLLDSARDQQLAHGRGVGGARGPMPGSPRRSCSPGTRRGAAGRVASLPGVRAQARPGGAHAAVAASRPRLGAAGPAEPSTTPAVAFERGSRP